MIAGAVLVPVVMPLEDWVRRARPLLHRYKDGDTFSLDLDLAFHLVHGIWTDPRGKETDRRLRLAGVKAPERYDVGGPEATAFMHEWLLEATRSSLSSWPLITQTLQLDSFDRYIAWVWRVSDGRLLNADLVEAGHANWSI